MNCFTYTSVDGFELRKLSLCVDNYPFDLCLSAFLHNFLELWPRLPELDDQVLVHPVAELDRWRLFQPDLVFNIRLGSDFSVDIGNLEVLEI